MKLTKEIETSFQQTQAVVERWLNEYGYECSQERVIGPYTADIFLDKYRVDVECDSIYHYPKRDKKRDKYLLDTYNIRTFRINYDDIVEINKERIMTEFEVWLHGKN